MTRYAPGTEQFISEVQQALPKAKVEPHGDPDGLGVTRSVRFDADSSEQLKDILEALDGDDRIESSKRDAHGLTVTFSPTYRADFAHPFGVAEANAVLAEEEKAVDEKPAAKKATAKKTVSPDN